MWQLASFLFGPLPILRHLLTDWLRRDRDIDRDINNWELESARIL
ncbi:MAG: hypothetical protein JWM12_3830 [Ilumatobacteraceae bacterium]|nr:hypothetical protein [Ilumatobacteraceae bacterium]